MAAVRSSLIQNVVNVHNESLQMGIDIRSVQTINRMWKIMESTVNDSKTNTDMCSTGNTSQCRQIVQEYEHSDHWLSPTSQGLLIAFYCVVSVIGLVGNGLVIYIVLKHKHLRCPRNILILNLSICDILMCIFVIPFSLIRLTLKNWYLGEFLCRVSPTFQAIDVFVSTFTIVAIAVDRYMAIVCQASNQVHKNFVYYVILLVWLVSIVLCIPMMIFHNVVDVKPEIMGVTLYKICMEVWPNNTMKKIYTTAVLAIMYIAPMITLSCLHGKICQFLRLRISENPRTEAEVNRALRECKRHRRNMILLTVIAVTFAIAWLPLTVLNTVVDYDYKLFLDKNFNEVYGYCLLIAMCSAFMNPIIYGWFNSNFRQQLLATLCCRHMEKPNSMEFATIKNTSSRSRQRKNNYNSIHKDSS